MGFRARGLGFRVGCRIWDVGFTTSSSGVKVAGLGVSGPR